MKKILLVSAFIICCLFVSVFALQTTDTAMAENVDVTVSLNGGSLLTAFNEDFAYTEERTVFVAKNNKIYSYKEERSDE